jgi:FkbM family methyltransferase
VPGLIRPGRKSLARVQLPHLVQYSRELRLCFQLGADVTSRFSLAQNTLLFHLANGRLIRGGSHLPGDATLYRIRIRAKPHDLWLRTFAGDLFVLHEVFLSRCYALPKTFSTQPEVVVDLGAHVGLTTLFWYANFGRAQYVCVEPSPANIALLQRNVAALEAQVYVVPAAISSTAGHVHFNPGRWSWGGQLDTSAHQGFEVRCTTMHEIISSLSIRRIDLLKVDIENGVESLFRHNNAWLSKVQTIVAELWSGYGESELAQDIAPYGLRVVPQGSRIGNRMVMAVRDAAY